MPPFLSFGGSGGGVAAVLVGVSSSLPFLYPSGTLTPDS